VARHDPPVVDRDALWRQHPVAAEVRDAVRRFPVEGDEVTALDRIDLEVLVGRMTVVDGPSGSGK
jgi:ABC-type oligopeptide transport system ATPase subunit